LTPSSVPLPPKSVIRAVGVVYPNVWRVGLGVVAAAVLLLLTLLVVRGRLWTRLKGVVGRRHGAAPHPSLPPWRRSAAAYGRAAAVWGRRNRGEILVYTVAVVASVGSAFFVLVWLT
jgi:hypothetical protein